MCVLMFTSSHRPDGKGADMLSPTHAYATANASGQLQGVRAAETLKVSHGPDGKIADVLAPTHTCTNLHNCLRFGQLQWVRAAEIIENFPSPPWETHVLLVVCRVVVYGSLEAQCQS